MSFPYDFPIDFEPEVREDVEPEDGRDTTSTENNRDISSDENNREV